MFSIIMLGVSVTLVTFPEIFTISSKFSFVISSILDAFISMFSVRNSITIIPKSEQQNAIFNKVLSFKLEKGNLVNNINAIFLTQIMKLTKFAQSCVLIEAKGKRILIDPGAIQFEDSLLNEFWKDIDILLVTHKHGDHCHVPSVQKIVTEKTKFYTSQEVKDAYPELNPEVVKEGDNLQVDNVKIKVVKAVHGYHPGLKGDKEIHENIGFIVDDGEKKSLFNKRYYWV